MLWLISNKSMIIGDAIIMNQKDFIKLE